MRPDDGLEIPANTIVFHAEPQKVEQRIEQLAAVGLRGRGVVVAIFAVVLDDRFEHRGEQVDGSTAGNALIEIVHQAGTWRGIGIDFELPQPDFDPLVQNTAQVAQAEKLLREQLAAVAIDKFDQCGKALGVFHLLQHRKPQRTAMCEPARQEQLGQPLETLDHRHRRGRVGFADGRIVRGPRLGRYHEAFDQRLVPDAEQLVELGHRAGTNRVGALHFPRRFEQLPRFGQQAQSGHPREEVLNRSPPRPHGDNSRRRAATSQRNIQQWSSLEGLAQVVPMLPRAVGIAPHERGQHGDNLRLVRFEGIGIVGASGVRRHCVRRLPRSRWEILPACFVGRRQQTPGIGRHNAGGDDLLQQRLLEQSLPVVLDE